jgi:hypothetical protein
MKIAQLLAAGLLAAGIGMSGAATAQMNNGSYPPRDPALQTDRRAGDMGDHRMDGDMRGDRGPRTDMRDRGVDRRDYARDDRRGWGRNRRHGWNGNRRCHTEWRHHRRVRICR